MSLGHCYQQEVFNSVSRKLRVLILASLFGIHFFRYAAGFMICDKALEMKRFTKQLIKQRLRKPFEIVSDRRSIHFRRTRVKVNVYLLTFQICFVLHFAHTPSSIFKLLYAGFFFKFSPLHVKQWPLLTEMKCGSNFGLCYLDFFQAQQLKKSTHPSVTRINFILDIPATSLYHRGLLRQIDILYPRLVSCSTAMKYESIT